MTYSFDPISITMVLACLFMGAFICWLLYLHLLSFRRIRELERDNYRLIRRLGQYYSLPIGVADEKVPDLAYSEPISPSVPQFFKMKPSPFPPPPGSKKKG